VYTSCRASDPHRGMTILLIPHSVTFAMCEQSNCIANPNSKQRYRSRALQALVDRGKMHGHRIMNIDLSEK
jgi:hypothetical protein